MPAEEGHPTKKTNASHEVQHEVSLSHAEEDRRTIFNLGKPWIAQYEPTVEVACYAIQKPDLEPITKLRYEGWRRHIESQREKEEGGRFVFYLRDLDVLNSLARAMDNPTLKQIAWLEPIQIDPQDPLLVLNFKEKIVEWDPNYLDNLFNTIRSWGLNNGFSLESMPPDSVLEDLRKVIAHTCLDRFKKEIVKSHFENIEECIPFIRPTALRGVDSPFFTAALFCMEAEV